MNTSKERKFYADSAVYRIKSFIDDIQGFDIELSKKKEKADGNSPDLKEFDSIIQKLTDDRNEIVNTCNRRKLYVTEVGNKNLASKYCSMDSFRQLMKGYKSFYATSQTKEKCQKICTEAINFINGSIEWNQSERKKKSDLYIEEYHNALKDRAEKTQALIEDIKGYKDSIAQFERNHLIFDSNENYNTSTFPLGYVSNSRLECKIEKGLVESVVDFVKFCDEEYIAFDYSAKELKERVELGVDNVCMHKAINEHIKDTGIEEGFFINNYLIEHSNSSKATETINKGIEAFILNILSLNRNSDFEIILADPISNGSDFCDILDLCDEKYIGKINYTKADISSTLKGISDRIIDINKKIKSYKTVFHYNEEHPDDRIKPVFFIGYNICDEYYDSNLIKPIIENSGRCGFSLILIKNSQLFNAETDKLNAQLNYNNFKRIIVSPDSKAVFKNFSVTLNEFFFLKLPENHLEFIEDFKLNYIKAKPSEKPKAISEYTFWYSFEQLPEYSKEYKPLELPFGIDESGNIQTISFERENFAAYLVGASQSGKTTFIHTLISGLIRNYHPDNVELWLADFKQLEFRCYMKNTPPHVKYILLDESKELVCDLIDKINGEMLKRQQLLSRMGKLRLDEVDFSSLSEPLPIIFIILDEFSIMSQAIADLSDYKLKLQNVLAKGAALGFKFLFSSQSFVTGVSGLTLTARNQIQQRIAMKVKRDEILDVLELPNELKTDEVNHWINTLPPHYALIKSRVENENDTELTVSRNLVLYIDDYEKRNKMIDDINERMKCSDEYCFEKTNQYVNKHPVFVDGNSYQKFDKAEFSKAVSDKKYDGILYSFGTPRLMNEKRFVSLANETRENILLISPAEEAPCAASIILSAIKQSVMQDTKVELWAHPNNILYNVYKEQFSLSGAVIYEGMDAVCSRILDVKSNIQNREENQSLIIMLGMDRISADFEYYDVYMPSNQRTVNNAGLNKDIMNAQQSVRMKLVEKIMELDGDSSLSQDEKSKIVSEYQVELEREYRINSEANSITANSTDTSRDSFDAGVATAYDASKDYSFIVKNGSKFGYHCLLYLNSYFDFKQMRSKGIMLDFFKHKMAFNLSVDDSLEVFRSRIASMLLQHICQYDDTISGFSFRPFLHNGVEWEGWSVDENEEIINPYISI